MWGKAAKWLVHRAAVRQLKVRILASQTHRGYSQLSQGDEWIFLPRATANAGRVHVNVDEY
jgi:hypothetical protein